MQRGGFKEPHSSPANGLLCLWWCSFLCVRETLCFFASTKSWINWLGVLIFILQEQPSWLNNYQAEREKQTIWALESVRRLWFIVDFDHSRPSKVFCKFLVDACPWCKENSSTSCNTASVEIIKFLISRNGILFLITPFVCAVLRPIQLGAIKLWKLWL
jgi:hypothetical protein